uniref:Uncharacterized protein n=1 Tax=Zea mays TaxID=4577 RepID=A0A804RSU8_MAIZE
MLELLARRRAGRRVPAGGRTGNGPLGGLPRASNNRLRTGRTPRSPGRGYAPQVSSAEPRTPSRPSRGRSAPYRAQLRLALLAAWPAVVRP